MAEGDEEVLTAMPEASGTDLAGYKAPLDATEMFHAPADGVAQAQSPELPDTIVGIAAFLFDKGILGVGAPSSDFIGIEYPEGTATGDEGNVQLRLDAVPFPHVEVGLIPASCGTCGPEPSFAHNPVNDHF